MFNMYFAMCIADGLHLGSAEGDAAGVTHRGVRQCHYSADRAARPAHLLRRVSRSARGLGSTV